MDIELFISQIFSLAGYLNYMFAIEFFIFKKIWQELKLILIFWWQLLILLFNLAGIKKKKNWRQFRYD